MSRTILYRNRRTNSGRSIARGLGIRRTMATGSRFGARRGDTILNWGCSESTLQAPDERLATDGEGIRWINSCAAVRRGVSKSITLRTLQSSGVPTPDFTERTATAQAWLESGRTVMVRTSTTGSRAQGLLVLSGGEEAPRAPLYTAYFRGHDEYRVHVGVGRVLDVQQKRARRGAEVNYQVRTHANGWVFCREGISIPDGAMEASVAAVQALGLDFGAVDIKAHRDSGQVAVLEVNTAPGLEGTTLARYLDYFRSIL